MKTNMSNVPRNLMEAIMQAKSHSKMNPIIESYLEHRFAKAIAHCKTQQEEDLLMDLWCQITGKEAGE